MTDANARHAKQANGNRASSGRGGGARGGKAIGAIALKDPVLVMLRLHLRRKGRHSAPLPLVVPHPRSIMARHKLDLEPEPDAVVIGISSHVNDYRLCWALNKRLGVTLTRREKDIVASTGAQFAAYDHQDEETGARLMLISNRSEGVLLLKDQKQADYFLVMNEESPRRPEEIMEQVRNTEFVLAAFTLDLKRLRSGHELFV